MKPAAVLVNLHCGVLGAPCAENDLLERTPASLWWLRWLRPCGGSPTTPWWWVGDADRLFHRGDDTGENPSLLGTASMAPSASLPS